jgi:hypothetical protein
MASNATLDQSGVSDSNASERASESYRRRAAECRSRAATAHDVAERLNYLQLTEYWNDMARDAEVQDRIRWQTLRVKRRALRWRQGRGGGPDGFKLCGGQLRGHDRQKP